MKTTGEGEPTAEAAQIPVLDRPIETTAQDKLERGAFIRRLADAVIDSTTGRATGGIIGVTGPWGSGKSSVLNLLANQILESQPEAIVVRFDPWLISGRNDLIAEFIAELIAELQQKPAGKERFKAAVEKLVQYGSMISPLADLVPYVGPTLKQGLNSVAERLKREKSLHEQRRELLAALADVNGAIVVLIDELDRIEDEEIRIVAQLVRSIADFPGISYVLAYDAKRVIRALGGLEKNLERGQAYLEKIVQLQIPLPILLVEELHALIEADLDRLRDDDLVPGDRASNERYVKLRDELLIPQLIGTPRDVKRLISAFGVLVRMVGREVDWIDLLGFCAVLVKAPLTAERIKDAPDALADDPISPREIVARFSEAEASGTQLLKSVNPENEGGPAIRNLLTFLFPRLSGEDKRQVRIPGTLICKIQPLLTTLRLDLVPGFYSREMVFDTFRLKPSDVEAFLKTSYEADRIDRLLTKIEATRDELAGFRTGILLARRSRVRAKT
jgi:predicted KAP-like P-loop ATPase